MKRLQSLGYLHPASPTGDRNIAAILFEQGKFAEAAAAYAKLVKDKPDDSGLHASLSGALGALGRYDQAFAEASKAIELDPLNAEAYHNRAVIHERKGERDAAIADYRLALKANSSYAATRQALSRLGVQADAAAPARSPAETQAMALADQASISARRGDYKAALAQLDQASRLAPSLAMVWQYRSNVAFLMGDTPGAIAALRKGLEIEPGNLLFKENLKRLEQSKKR
jgi:tetratricopeptide (TPR) repeat protein